MSNFVSRLARIRRTKLAAESNVTVEQYVNQLLNNAPGIAVVCADPNQQLIGVKSFATAGEYVDWLAQYKDQMIVFETKNVPQLEVVILDTGTGNYNVYLADQNGNKVGNETNKNAIVGLDQAKEAARQLRDLLGNEAQVRIMRMDNGRVVDEGEEQV